jgi:hypothetical protein
MAEDMAVEEAGHRCGVTSPTGASTSGSMRATTMR